jgi:UDP-GlcNAc:undecaprenyl-phosphate/decaprenyl-phosphate GlcNAc-1-phosphate transferase
MTTQVLRIAGIPLLAFVLASLALPLVKRLARYCRIVGVPLVDSGHRELTPLLGGVAIIGAILAALAAARALPFWMLFGAVGLFAIGLVDDAIALGPRRKLIAQIAVILV